MNRKEKICIIISFALLIGMTILIRNNRQLTNLLEETNLKLAQNEVELNSVLWSNSQHYLYANSKITNFNVITIKGEKKPFSSILVNDFQIFYKFSSSDCIECVEAELKISKNEAQHTMILAETSDSRWLNAFIEANHINKESIFQIEKALLKEGELPFYFVSDNELYIKDILFPIKELPNFSADYYKTIRSKYSK